MMESTAAGCENQTIYLDVKPFKQCPGLYVIFIIALLLSAP